jgi:hypothetical protein
MMLGMSLATLTVLHVVLSLVGMLAGAIVVVGMLGSRRLPVWSFVFLATTALTSISGFMFPVDGLVPPHVIGAVSLLALAAAAVALYAGQLAGSWRSAYVIGVFVGLYLNVVIGVVQAFGKLQSLQSLAPTPAALPHLVVQVVVLLIFVALGIMAAKSFRPEADASILPSEAD